MATLKITNFNGELGANRKYYQFTASLPARHLLCGFVCSVQPPPVDSIYKDLEHSWRIAKTRCLSFSFDQGSKIFNFFPCLRSLVRDYEAFMAAPILHQSRTQVTVVCSRKFYNSGAFEKLIVDYGFKFVIKKSAQNIR